jgi:L-aspartate semialdehyde sulfurtransferase ferredoxin
MDGESKSKRLTSIYYLVLHSPDRFLPASNGWEGGFFNRKSHYPRFRKALSATRIRIHLQIPTCYRHEPLISRLISQLGLAINITGAMAGNNTDERGYFDLELQGTPQQISAGLAYLKSLNFRVIGKPNSDGDGWHY